MSVSPDSFIAVVRRHRGRLSLAAVLMVLTAGAGVALIGLSAWFLTGAALAGSLIAFNLFAPSAGIRGLTLTRIGSRYLEKLAGHDATLRMARDLRVWFFARALPLAPARLGRFRTGDLLAQVMADVDVIDGLFLRVLGPWLALLATGIAALAFLFMQLPVAGALLALALSILLLLTIARWRDAARLESECADAVGAVREQAFTGIEAAADLRSLDAMPRWLHEFDRRTGTLARLNSRRKRRLARAALLHAMIVAVAMIGLVGLVLDAFQSGQLSGTRAAMLVFLGVALFEVWAPLPASGQALRAGAASVRRLRSLVEQPPAVVDPVMPRVLPNGGSIDLENVRFAYPGSRQRVLDGVDLCLGPGERVVIRGDSGSGKSTLAQLLLRTFDPDVGRIAIAGEDIRNVRQADVHARIAYLSQHTPIFAGTIRENLRLGSPEASDETVWRVLDQVRLSDKVRGLSHGLATWVGENGASLSAGEGRRLALARALLRDAPILLLDEPTEGLDHATAMAVLADLGEHLGDRTLLLITHGPVPTGLVDRCYVLADGRLHPADELLGNR